MKLPKCYIQNGVKIRVYDPRQNRQIITTVCIQISKKEQILAEKNCINVKTKTFELVLEKKYDIGSTDHYT